MFVNAQGHLVQEAGDPTIISRAIASGCERLGGGPVPGRLRSPPEGVGLH